VTRIGTDDAVSQQYLRLTFSKGWIARILYIETMKPFVSTGRMIVHSSLMKHRKLEV
jgi:hypothetical protein